LLHEEESLWPGLGRPHVRPPARPCGKQREEGGLGQLQGKTEFCPKAMILIENPLKFSKIFIKGLTNFNPNQI
jgi:hypothetical protein